MKAPRSSVRRFVVLALLATAAIAFFASPYASSEPDGLERVSMDTGFADTAGDHGLAGSPLADYGVSGVDDPGLSTGLSGLVGVALCFGLAAGLTVLVRRAGPAHSTP